MQFHWATLLVQIIGYDSVSGFFSDSFSRHLLGSKEWTMIMIAVGQLQPNSVMSHAELSGNFIVRLKDRLRHISKKCFVVT